MQTRLSILFQLSDQMSDVEGVHLIEIVGPRQSNVYTDDKCGVAGSE